MSLNPEWKTIVKKAYSIRWIMAAALFSGLEVVVPLFNGYIPRNLFGAISFFCTIAAFIARLIAQRDTEFHHADEPPTT